MTYEFDRKTRKKRRWGRVYEYSSYERSILVNEQAFHDLTAKVVEEVAKSRGLTAQEIANRHNIRVSVAKQILNTLLEDGQIQLLLTAQNVKLFGPV